MPDRSPSLPFLGLSSEGELRSLADALPDAMFTTDLDGVITFWNRGAERITGYSREDAIGQPCSLLAGDMVHGCSCGAGPIRCGMVERGRMSRCCTLRARDGREVRIVKNAVPLLGPGGVPAGALETFTTVDEVVAFNRAVTDSRRAAASTADFCGMTGRARAMRELYRMIELVACSDATVMILGESGSGKELAAEAIHRMSPRAPQPFIRVSCSALNENLLESELFGHVKGAFTGALRDRRGRFQEADGGTLLLDEIGDVSPVVQVKLLRVIERREFERVGDSQPVRVDVRLLCATNRDLKQLVSDGRFRADLYFRLAVFPLRVPPLREHLEDVGPLAAQFLSRRGHRTRVSEDALAVLQAHAWPGNVRELQNVLEYAALQSGGGEIRPEHLAVDLLRPDRPPAAETPAPQDERQETLEALERAGWHRTAAANALGISRVTLWKRIRRHGLRDPDRAN
jgi:transcriptional regulator with PAS, ATPase and Fis domain